MLPLIAITWREAAWPLRWKITTVVTEGGGFIESTAANHSRSSPRSAASPMPEKQGKKPVATRAHHCWWLDASGHCRERKKLMVGCVAAGLADRSEREKRDTRGVFGCQGYPIWKLLIRLLPVICTIPSVQYLLKEQFAEINHDTLVNFVEKYDHGSLDIGMMFGWHPIYTCNLVQQREGRSERTFMCGLAEDCSRLSRRTVAALCTADGEGGGCPTVEGRDAIVRMIGTVRDVAVVDVEMATGDDGYGGRSPVEDGCGEGARSSAAAGKLCALPSGELRAAMVWEGKAELSQRQGRGTGAVPAVILIGAATSSTTSVRDRRQRQNRAAAFKGSRAPWRLWHPRHPLPFGQQQQQRSTVTDLPSPWHLSLPLRSSGNISNGDYGGDEELHTPFSPSRLLVPIFSKHGGYGQ
nr:hypothetical protein Iba_chr05aCG8750 [Ipomoea batatas]